MVRGYLRQLLDAEPFEPFRIKLVNGDIYDIFDPHTIAIEARTIFLAPRDQNWTVVLLDKIASIESLFADFHGEAARHDAP